jgi:hypothetical protein
MGIMRREIRASDREVEEGLPVRLVHRSEQPLRLPAIRCAQATALCSAVLLRIKGASSALEDDI